MTLICNAGFISVLDFTLSPKPTVLIWIIHPSATKQALSDFCGIHLFLSSFVSLTAIFRRSQIQPLVPCLDFTLLLNILTWNHRVRFFFLLWNHWWKDSVLCAIYRMAQLEVGYTVFQWMVQLFISKQLLVTFLSSSVLEKSHRINYKTVYLSSISLLF